MSNEEFQVFMHDLADSEETTQRIDTIGEYALHDLALLDGSEVDSSCDKEGHALSWPTRHSIDPRSNQSKLLRVEEEVVKS